MIKKYYSKYTGKQIDEAVAALIENNIKIEDLNEEVVELINSKANEEDLAALKEEVNNEFKVALEDLVGSASEPTPVPTSGMIENVYFNHNLTGEQFDEVCSKITFNIGSTCTYTIFQTANTQVYLAGYWNSSKQTVEHLELRTNRGFEYSFNEWQNGFSDTYEINEEITYAGTQNDLLVNLVSITPFAASKGRVGELEAAVEELHNEINELEELIGDSSNSVVSYEKGTPVPNQGYLEKVYLNDSLTPEEVDSILNNADIEFYSTPGGYDIYELLRTNEVNNWPETIISIYKYNFSEENYGYIITTNKYTQHYPLYISPTLTDLSDVIIRNNYEKRGWMFDSSNGEDNVSNPCYIIGYPHNELQTTGIWSNVGLNNDAIASIVSTTPFTKQAINEPNKLLSEFVSPSTLVLTCVNSSLVSLIACFVNGVADTIEAIVSL